MRMNLREMSLREYALGSARGTAGVSAVTGSGGVFEDMDGPLSLEGVCSLIEECLLQEEDDSGTARAWIEAIEARGPELEAEMREISAIHLERYVEWLMERAGEELEEQFGERDNKAAMDLIETEMERYWSLPATYGREKFLSLLSAGLERSKERGEIEESAAAASSSGFSKSI